MAFEPITHAWSALKQHKETRKAARRTKRKQKQAEVKVLAAQLKRADDLKRIKSPKSSADYVLRHFYEADEDGKCGRKNCPACGTPFFMQVAEKAAAETKADTIHAAPDSSTLLKQNPGPDTTTHPTNTSRASSSSSDSSSGGSSSSSSSASPDEAVTIIPVNTSASTLDAKPAVITTAPTIGALLAASTNAVAGPTNPQALMSPMTVMLATCAQSPTPEQLSAIAAASSAKHRVAWLSSLPDSKAAGKAAACAGMLHSKAVKGSGSKAAGALPGSPTSPGSPLIMAGTDTPAAADDRAGNAAAAAAACEEQNKQRKAPKAAACEQQAGQEKQAAAELAEVESEAAAVEAASVTPRHSSAGMGQALRRVDAWSGDVMRMMIEHKVLPKLKRTRSASVSMWAKAAKALTAPFKGSRNRAAALANVRAY